MLGSSREELKIRIPPRPIVGSALTHVYTGAHGCSHRTLIEVGTNGLEAKFGKVEKLVKIVMLCYQCRKV